MQITLADSTATFHGICILDSLNAPLVFSPLRDAAEAESLAAHDPGEELWLRSARISIAHEAELSICCGHTIDGSILLFGDLLTLYLELEACQSLRIAVKPRNKLQVRDPYINCILTSDRAFWLPRRIFAVV